MDCTRQFEAKERLTRPILPVWNSFIKNLFTTKSSEFKSVFLKSYSKGYASWRINELILRRSRLALERLTVIGRAYHLRM